MNSITPQVQALIDAAVKAAVEATLANLAVQPEAGSEPAAPAVAKPYRSKPGKEAAKVACAELAVKYDLKVAGGKRTFKSLSAKEQAAYRAESKAIWAAVPKTRTTKA